MRKTLLFAVVLLMLAPVYAQQPGSIDPSFGNGGVSDTIPDRTGFLGKIGVQPDGKIIAAGNRNDSDPDSNYHFLVRYTLDGKLDKTFSRDGILFERDLQVGYGTFLGIQKDGKIIITDQVFTETANGSYTTDIALIRYKAMVHGMLCSVKTVK